MRAPAGLARPFANLVMASMLFASCGQAESPRAARMEWTKEQAKADKLLADNKTLLAQFKKSPVQTPVAAPVIVPAVPAVQSKEQDKIDKMIQVLEEIRREVNAKSSANANGSAANVTLENVPVGDYLLKVRAGAVPTLSPTTVVSIGPNPTPTPVPSVLTDRAKAIKAAADKATGDPKREETAQGLAALYREIAANCRAPGHTNDASSVISAAKSVTNLLLAHQGSAAPAAWQPMRDVLSGYAVAMLQEGKPVVGDGDDFAKLFDEAASGLEASAPMKSSANVYRSPAGLNTVGISPEFWKFLLELMDLLKTLLPLLIH